MINVIINGTKIEILAIPSDNLSTIIASAKDKIKLIEKLEAMEEESNA